MFEIEKPSRKDLAAQRKLQRQLAETMADLAAQEERAAWLAALPLKMLQLMARAHPLATVTAVRGECPAGVEVQFRFVGNRDEQQVLSLDAEEWEFLLVEQTVIKKEEELEAATKKRALARATYDSLTVEQRAALNLTTRP